MPKNKCITMASILLFFLSFQGISGQESGEVHPGGKTFTLKSKILNEERIVSIALPDSYHDSERAFPVLITLDGEDFFSAFAGTVSYYSRIGKCPELIVIGIEAVDRWRDYTPTRADIPDGTPVPNSGGADAFLGFIDRELMGYVRENYRVTPFHVLCGHSIGGLFVVNTLFEESSGFSAYIATSPSLWWDGELMKKKAVHAAARKDSRSSTLFMTMGNEGASMLDPALDFTRALEADSGENLIWTFRRFEDADHQTMPVKAFAYGLDFIFSDWRMPPEISAEGLEAVQAYYGNLSRKYRQVIEVPENVLNRLGYMEMNKGKLGEALEIFKLNVDKHPGSANAYDSLGEAFLKSGDTENAVRYYRKSLELNPENDNARAVLIKLGCLR